MPDFAPEKYKEADAIARGLEEATKRMDAIKASVQEAQVKDSDARRSVGYDALALAFRNLRKEEALDAFSEKLKEFSYEAGRVEERLKTVLGGGVISASEKSFVPVDAQVSELRSFFDFLESSVKSEPLLKALKEKWFDERSFDGFASKFRGGEVFSIMEKKPDVAALKSSIEEYASLDIDPFFKKILDELVLVIDKWLSTRRLSDDERLERDARELGEFKEYAEDVDEIGRAALEKERAMIETIREGRKKLLSELDELDRLLKSWTPGMKMVEEVRAKVLEGEEKDKADKELRTLTKELEGLNAEGVDLAKDAKALSEQVKLEVSAGSMKEDEASKRVAEMVAKLKANDKKRTELKIRIRGLERRL